MSCFINKTLNLFCNELYPLDRVMTLWYRYIYLLTDTSFPKQDRIYHIYDQHFNKNIYNASTNLNFFFLMISISYFTSLFSRTVSISHSIISFLLINE